MKKITAKIIKPIILIMLVSFLLIPTVALASWWDPFSWSIWNIFKPQTKTIISPTTAITPTAVITPVKDKETKSSDSKPVPTTKPDNNQVIKRIETPKIETPVIEPTTPAITLPTNRQQSESQQTGQNNTTVDTTAIDQQLSQLISQIRQEANTFSNAKTDADNFVYTVTNKMSEYPNSSLMQQSGQQLLTAVRDLSSVSENLFNIDNARIATLTSFLGSGKIPSDSDFSTPTVQYKNYRNQYDSDNAQVKSLMETFVANESTVLKESVDKKNKISQALNQLNIVVQGINSQLADLNSQIQEKKTEITNEENRQASMSSINARVAPLIAEANSLINQYNALLDKKNRIGTIIYEINDYDNYGTVVPAEDRAFLSSLGINP